MISISLLSDGNKKNSRASASTVVKPITAATCKLRYTSIAFMIAVKLQNVSYIYTGVSMVLSVWLCLSIRIIVFYTLSLQETVRF